MKRVYQTVTVIAILLGFFGLVHYHRVISVYYDFEMKPHPGPLRGSSSVTKGAYAGDKIIVMSEMAGENASWVDELRDWQSAIYHPDDPDSILHVPRNKGREAMTYLTFIVDHFDNLPEIIVFLHPHKSGWPEAWHTDAPSYDNAESVRSLQLDYVRQHGYANMRCISNPGCPVELRPHVIAQGNSLSERTSNAYGNAWMQLFQTDISTVPEVVAAACCAQFTVSREQVLKRPLSDYERIRQWLLDTELSDEISGRVMEYTWHVIFGKDPVWCPELSECWCQQFGRC